MTEDERRSSAHAAVIQYADSKRDLNCLRHRLRTTVRVLELLRLPEEQHPAPEEARPALDEMKSLRRDPREDIQEYVDRLERHRQLAKSARDHGYGAVVGEDT